MQGNNVHIASKTLLPSICPECNTLLEVHCEVPIPVSLAWDTKKKCWEITVWPTTKSIDWDKITDVSHICLNGPEDCFFSCTGKVKVDSQNGP